jgi:hypothetical protein
MVLVVVAGMAAAATATAEIYVEAFQNEAKILDPFPSEDYDRDTRKN